jgi:hypothetical protein
MTDDTPIISGINIISRPKPWDNGDTALAFFNVLSGGFEICGCMLIKRKSGTSFFSVMPRGSNDNSLRAVLCHDKQLLDTITSAAKRAFEALGGKL